MFIFFCLFFLKQVSETEIEKVVFLHVCMQEEPSLCLTHSFEFRGRHARYKVSFYKNYLNIEEPSSEPEKVSYSAVYKIKSNSEWLKIILRSNEILEIPCTINEIRKIRKLCKRSLQFSPSKIRCSAFVEFGDVCFFLKIHSNHFSVIRTAIIKRIARFFYPAFDQEGISLESFQSFVFKIRKGNRLITIDNSEDLDAALAYFDHKIDVIIEYAND